MKHTLLIYPLSFLMIVFLFSCSGVSKKEEVMSPKQTIREEKKEDAKDKAMETEAAASKDESDSKETKKTAAIQKQEDFGLTSNQNLEQSGKKFIRTAEVRFKTALVSKATFSIEDLTAKHRGFITSSELRSNLHRTATIELSEDSLQNNSFYTVENKMEIKIPNQSMDSFLRELNGLVEYLDYRIIKASDVSLNLLANQFRQERLQQYNQKQGTAIDQKAQDLGQNTYAQNELLNKQNQLDDNKIQEMKTLDDIAYSTIVLYIYQNDKVHQEVIENYNSIKSNETGFGRAAQKAFYNGIWILKNLLLLLINIWPFVIMFGALLWVLLYLQRKEQQRKAQK